MTVPGVFSGVPEAKKLRENPRKISGKFFPGAQDALNSRISGQTLGQHCPGP